MEHESQHEYEGGRSGRFYRRFRTATLAVTGFFALVTLASIIFILFLFFGPNAHGISLSLEAPSEIYVGVPFEIKAVIANKGNDPQNDASLHISLPATLIALGDARGTGDDPSTQVLGTLSGGSVITRTFHVISTEAGSFSYSARVSYSAPDGTHGSVNGDAVLVSAEHSGGISLDMPDRIMKGSAFEFTIRYENISDIPQSGLGLSVEYPDSFIFDSASAEPDATKHSWNLGTVASNTKGSITVRGSYNGDDSEPITFRATLTRQIGDKSALLGHATGSAVLSPSPVALSITMNGDERYIAHAGDSIDVVIHYENNSGVALSNVIVKANIESGLLSSDVPVTNGEVDPRSKWITWNSDVVPSFALLDAGAKGELHATVALSKIFPIVNSFNKNFTVTARAKLSSPTIPYYIASKQLNIDTATEARIAGMISVTPELYFMEPAAEITNHGTLPPTVGHETEFTVHLMLRNYATDIRDLEVRIPLSEYVKFISGVHHEGTPEPTYNADTREVIWNVDAVSATKGAIGAPLVGIFKVKLIPPQSLVGKFAPILAGGKLSAHDDFSGITLGSITLPVTTAELQDTPNSSNFGRVMP